MEYKLNVIDKTKQEVEFDIPADELAPYFERAYLKYRTKVNVPGFRKGKAPIAMIKKLYGDAIEHDSLEDIAAETFSKYVKDNNIYVIGEGSITDMKLNHETGLKVKVQYEIKPEFELKHYKGLEVTKPVYDVDEKMVDEEIKYQQSKHCTYEITERADNDEYLLTLDMQKLDKNNIPIIGYKQDKIKVYLNDRSLEEDLKKQLEGIGLNETRVVRLKSRDKDDFENYSLNAAKIEKIVYPELNEDFFKKISKQEITDAEQFGNFIKSDLEKVYSRVSEQELENNIVSEIIRTNDVPAPDVLVEKILNSKMDEIKNKNPKRELPPGFDIEEYKKTNKVDVILQVKWHLIKEKILGEEMLEVTPEEAEKSVQEYSARYNLPAEKVRKLFEKNDDLKHDLLSKKLMDFLKANSIIKEIKQTNETESRIYA